MTAPINPFKKATKEQLKARIALDGPTGAGKTYSALVFATALVEKTGGKIAVIDTENDRARTYANKFEFDHVSLKAPYSPQRYVDLINMAISNGYEVVVIDSLSHAWAAEGGVLDIKDQATERSRSKNSFDAWRHASPEHDKLVNALVNCPIHVIGTMRSKMAYILEEHERDGRKVQIPRKVGMQPVQREGTEYEFDLILDIDLDHVLIATKSRYDELADKIIRNPNRDPSETFAAARQFRDWLNSGEAPPRLVWLDDLCDTFGEGETLDAINAFRVKGGKQPLVSITQVADVPEDRVALLRSYLEDQVSQAESDPDAVSPSAAEGEEPTAPNEGESPDDAAQPADAPATEQGDGGSPGSPDPGNGRPPAVDAFEKAKAAASKKKTTRGRARGQTELGAGAEAVPGDGSAAAEAPASDKEGATA